MPRWPPASRYITDPCMRSASGSSSTRDAPGDLGRGGQPAEAVLGRVRRPDRVERLAALAATASTIRRSRGVSAGPGADRVRRDPARAVDQRQLAHEVEDPGVDRPRAGLGRARLEPERPGERDDPGTADEVVPDGVHEPQQAAELHVGADGEHRRVDRLGRAADRQPGGEDGHPDAARRCASAASTPQRSRRRPRRRRCPRRRAARPAAGAASSSSDSLLRATASTRSPRPTSRSTTAEPMEPGRPDDDGEVRVRRVGPCRRAVRPAVRGLAGERRLPAGLDVRGPRDVRGDAADPPGVRRELRDVGPDAVDRGVRVISATRAATRSCSSRITSGGRPSMMSMRTRGTATSGVCAGQVGRCADGLSRDVEGSAAVVRRGRRRQPEHRPDSARVPPGRRAASGRRAARRRDRPRRSTACRRGRRSRRAAAPSPRRRTAA